MPRPALLAALPVLLLGGCLHSAMMPVNLVSRAEFPPAERTAVWSRALVALHQFAPLATVADPEVATTTEHERVETCRRRECRSRGLVQVIVTPAGQLSARYNRVFSGKVGIARGGARERLLLEEDVAKLQYWLDDWVAEIVGGKGVERAKVEPAGP